MAKYYITHSCGHEHEYSLFGRHSERDRKIEWLEGQDCPACRRKAEEEAAKAATEGMELAQLIGSPKQIAWAETIRGNAIDNMGTRDTTGCTPGTCKWIPDNERRALAARIRTARWWIDNRDEEMTLELLKSAVEEDEEAAQEEQEEVEARARRKREWNEYQRKIRNGEVKRYDYLNEKFGWEPKSPAPKATTPAPEQDTPEPKGSEWGKVAVNRQNIETTTGKAAKIKMPHSSEYDGFTVWVSLKLLRKGRHSYEHMLSIKGDMEFKLVKYGSGKWNKFTKVDEKTISAADMAAAFGGWVSDAPRFSEPAVDPEKEEIVKHVPAPLAPVEIEADPELVR